MLDRWAVIDHPGGYGPLDLVLQVRPSEALKVGARVKVPRTGELLRVERIHEPTLIEVERGIGAAGALRMDDGEDLFVLPEGDYFTMTVPDNVRELRRP